MTDFHDIARMLTGAHPDSFLKIAGDELVAAYQRARVPVAISTHLDDEVALCSDGSYWMLTREGWKELPPIPGTPRACDSCRAGGGGP